MLVWGSLLGAYLAGGFVIVDVGGLREGESMRFDISGPLSIPEQSGVVESLALSGRILRHLGASLSFLVEGELSVAIVSPCARCLEEACVSLSDVFCERFTEKAEDESYQCDTHSIDLEHAIRDNILLGMPPKIICQEDCAGLCACCGANQNRENCGCEDPYSIT